MRTTGKTRILVGMAAIFLIASLLPCALADTKQSREYQLKAAFMFNFIKFVDWPKDPTKTDPNSPIILGIIGKSPFANAFEPLQQKEINGRKVVIKYFKSCEELKESKKIEHFKDRTDLNEIKACQVLFVCKSEKSFFNEITRHLKKTPALTVGDSSGFLEAGGIINFLVEDQKVRFEVNSVSAKYAGLNIRSQLLRLAKRVVKDDTEYVDKP